MTTQWCIRVTTAWPDILGNGWMTRVTAKRRTSTRHALASPNRGRMPPLHMVRAFEAVARMGSMRRAADDIGISHSVISRHIRHLEAWLRVRLMAAGPRGVKLTREGAVFFAAASRAFGTLAAATAELKPSSRRRTLRIWCMPGLATRWLTPRLVLVQQTLPDAELVLRASDRLPDFSLEEADLMIGFADPRELPDGAAPLVQPRMFPVASQQWVRDNGPPRSLEWLASRPLIHEESRQQWMDWFEAAGVSLDRPLSGPRLSDANLGFDAALAGVGVALATRLTASEEIADGRLVELFKTNIRLGGYFLLASPSLRKNSLTLGFQDWLISHLAATEDFAEVRAAT
jgi:LysR family transcriptional regulator, glycine cleavage system transcriptional activator